MNGDDFIAPLCTKKIEIIYEDDSLLVVNKPSGLLSLSGKNPLNKDSVHFRLVQQYPSAKMVHRLDFGTSGVMVLALSKDVNTHLSKQLQCRTMVKQYMATLYGHIKADNGVIDAPIRKAEFPYQKVCHETGKASQSRYRVVERTQNAAGINVSRVIFTPLTGRTHQLRVHSREIGHPIIGCDLYGLTVNSVNTTDLANRLCLHASSLTFDHPMSAERLCFQASVDF